MWWGGEGVVGWRGQAIMWNNGTLYPIPHAAKYVDDSVCAVVPKGSTWARNPVPRIHTDTLGMAFQGKCAPPQKIGGKYKEDCQQFPTPCPKLEHATPANKMMGEWCKKLTVRCLHLLLCVRSHSALAPCRRWHQWSTFFHGWYAEYSI